MSDNLDTGWITQIVPNGQRPAGSVTIKANPQFASNVSNRANAYKNWPAKLKPALEDVADYVRIEMIPEIFEQEGPGWFKLSRRTMNERAAAGYGPAHPILKRTGDLFNELTQKSHPKHIEIIKTGKQARVTISGSSEKFIKNQTGFRAENIPARPMLPGTKHKVAERHRLEIQGILDRSIKGIIANGH